MEGLDPCIGIGFLIKNAEDLKLFEKAFSKEGTLSKISTVYKEKPNSSKIDMDINASSLSDSFSWEACILPLTYNIFY